MAKSGGRKRRPQGCSLRSHRLRRLKPLTPTLSPATHSAIPSMLPCCTSDLKRRLVIAAPFQNLTDLATRQDLALATYVWCVGFALDPDPNATDPRPFRTNVYNRSYSENWTEGVEVFHNPRALTPIGDELLPGAVHHRLRSDGQMVSLGPRWHPLSSNTLITIKPASWLERIADYLTKN